MKFLGDVDTSDYSLLNVMYHRNEDSLDIVLKKNTSNGKRLITIPQPKMEVYTTKPSMRTYTHNKTFIPIDDTNSHIVSYKNLPYEMAKILGGKYQDNIKIAKQTRNYSLLREYKYDPYVFGTDYDIENWYRMQWTLHYENNKEKYVTRSFMDIEVDSKGIEGFPNPGMAPVNAVTLLDAEDKNVYTFLLEDPENLQINELKTNMDEFILDLHESFDEPYGTLNYNLLFYNTEIELIESLFKVINKMSRDFLLVWNIEFDLQTLIERIKYHGRDPADIISHPDFSIKKAVFFTDSHDKYRSIADKSPTIQISSYTVYDDQMRIFAGIRKNQSEFQQYSLNYIGQQILKDSKIDFSDEADIVTLVRTNYRLFVKYNIKDVLLQYGIDNKTHDLDTMYSMTYVNSTSYNKIFKQTRFLTHRIAVDLFKDGYIIGNNVNRQKGTEVEYDAEIDFSNDAYAGGYVAEPLLMERVGVPILNNPSQLIYIYVCDYDYEAMYPNINDTHNIAAHTLIGKVFLPDFVNKSRYNMPDISDGKYDPGKTLIDDFITYNQILFGSKYLNLPTTEDLIKSLEGKS